MLYSVNFSGSRQEFLDDTGNSLGFIKDVEILMHKYSLNDYFDNWNRNTILPSYFNWKRIVRSRITAHENNAWAECLCALRYRTP